MVGTFTRYNGLSPTSVRAVIGGTGIRTIVGSGSVLSPRMLLMRLFGFGGRSGDEISGLIGCLGRGKVSRSSVSSGLKMSVERVGGVLGGRGWV